MQVLEVSEVLKIIIERFAAELKPTLVCGELLNWGQLHEYRIIPVIGCTKKKNKVEWSPPRRILQFRFVLEKGN